MKNLILVGTVLFLLGAQVNGQNLDSESNPCNLQDSTYGERDVHIWASAFQDTLGLDTFFVSFEKGLVNELYNETKLLTDYVRIYFTLPDSGEIALPGALMVPYSKNFCDIDETAKMLTANRLGVQGSILENSDEIEKEVDNWVTIYNDTIMDGLEKVYAYNFTWEEIMDVVDGLMGSNLWVIYGISDINDSDSDKPAIHMYLTSSNSIPAGEKIFIDFARPCPRLCGSLIKESREE